MSIKNFTVITQRIKNRSEGLISYVNYLKNEKSKSHKETSILSLPRADSDSFLSKTILNTVNFDNGNKKGGRKVESYAQSFDFVLPPTVNRPTPEQWKLIYKDIIIQAKKSLSLDEENTNEFASHCFANIHDQRNPHLNLLIPRIYKDKRLDQLDKKKILSDLKKTFNAAVLQHCGLDFKQYKPQDQNLGKRRKKWQYEQNQLIKAKEELAEQNLRLAEQMLEAKKLTEESEITKIEAETAKIEAERVKFEAETAKNEAEKQAFQAKEAVSFLSDMQRLFKTFKSNLKDWIKAINEENTLWAGMYRADTVESVNKIQNNDLYDDEIEDLVFTAIEAAEEQTKRKEISRIVKRKF